MVIARAVFIDLLAEKQIKVWTRKKKRDDKRANNEEKKETNKLVSNVKMCVSKVDYFLTQVI